MTLSKYETYMLRLNLFRQDFPDVSEGYAAMSLLMVFDTEAYHTYRHFAYDPSIYENVMPEFLQALQDRWYGE